jgi:hypothetical protein
MDVHNRRTYLRPAALIVVLLLHGSLILVLLRSKPVYRARSESELLSTIFFVKPEPRPAILSPEASLTLRRSAADLALHLLPESSIQSVDTTPPLENQTSVPQPVDWFLEAQLSAAEIAARGKQDRENPTFPPTASAPWDAHSHLLEATGHGLILRIPVRIPLDFIDHCFSDIDLGQTPYGPEERLQLGCALRKQPPRGDLFDSLRDGQPQE